MNLYIYTIHVAAGIVPGMVAVSHIHALSSIVGPYNRPAYLFETFAMGLWH